MKVVIAGGGSVGTSIALDLIDRHHDVTLMEQVGERAEKLKTMLPGVSVLAADACEYSSLAAADASLLTLPLWNACIMDRLTASKLGVRAGWPPGSG